MTETALANLAAWFVQSTLLTVAAALAFRLIRIDAPAVRYAWWRAVLALCLVLPLVQPWHRVTRPAADMSVLDLARAPAAGEAPVPTGAATAPAPAIRPSPQVSWPVVVVAVLAGGMLLRLAWLGLGLWRLRRLRSAGVPATVSDDIVDLHALLEEGAEVRRVPVLRQPVTFGVRRAIVLLPERIGTLSPAVQRAVIVHELWHVRRRDWVWSLGEEALRAVLWFHPAIWYLVSCVQTAREEVVDELSVLSTNARRSYLEALLAFADEPAVYPASPFIRRRQLFNRMLLISREAVMSPRRIIASTAGMAGVMVLTGWYGTLAFPLRASEVVTEPTEAQAPQQARDPRPDVARPETSREATLKAATAADPSNLANWLDLAKMQERRGAYDAAEQTMTSALAATGRSRAALVETSAFYNRNGQFDKTMAILEELAASDPTNPEGHQLVATYYWEKAQKDQTISPALKAQYVEAGILATDRALERRADYIEALTYKNILLRMQGNMETDTARRQQLYAEADALRTRAIELQKQRPGTQGTGGAANRPGAPPPPPPPPPPAEYYIIDGQQAMRIGGPLRTPIKLKDVPPVYPEIAQSARVSGLVIVEATIDPQGYVRKARILKSIPLLDAAALDAVKQWQFTPTVVEGVAVPVIMTVTVNFTLQ